MMLSFNSTMLVVLVYLIKEDIVFPLFESKEVLHYLSYLIYFGIAVTISGFCLWLSRFLSTEIITGGITEVEQADNSYLPSYLGYFFVSLGIENLTTLISIYMLIFIFTFNSQTLYFNPLFLLFGYKFYYVTTQNGKKIFLISRKEIMDTRNLKFDQIHRINNYTFIDRRK